jgi:hypothetical protein
VSESADAADSLGVIGFYYVSFADSVTASDLIGSAYLWNPVDDSQGSVWQAVDDSQGTGWVPVNDAQSTTWTDLNPEIQ